MWWRTDQLQVVDAAIGRARAGTPSLLWLEGDSGQGKTSLIAELAERADGFSRLSADGLVESRDQPYGLFAQWGIPAPIDQAMRPFQAAQILRAHLDGLATTGPVLLTVDDLQWADPESIDSLAWVWKRASGDRLLVVGAGHRIRPPAQPAWRRLLLDPGAVTLSLDGLALAEAQALQERLRPGIAPALARRLWEHTGGNPLYLGALLAEHHPDALAASARLPAPGDLAAGVAEQLARQPEAVAELVRAVAVLGLTWSSLRLAAELVGIADPIAAADVARQQGLLQQRSVDGLVQVRVSHTLVEAAVRAGIPAARLRDLHLSAAALASSRREALWHRSEAADRYDDVLAADLARFADELHERGEFREAARQLLGASAVTTDPALRESRWLDGLFEHVLARDDEDVEHVLSDVGWATDQVRRALVSAGLAIITRRWLDARRILDGPTEVQLACADARARWRLLTLRGWARVMTGAIDHALDAELAALAADPARDDALFGYLSFALAQTTIALRGTTATSTELIGAVVETRSVDTTRLAWRGSLYALSGRFGDGITLLSEATQRARDGLAGYGDGVFHAYLGYAQWMSGDWPAAARALRLARESRYGAGHPMVAATLPLLALTDAAYERALEESRQAEQVLLAAPWRPAVQVAAVATVLTRRLAGDDGRPQQLPGLRRAFGAPVSVPTALDSPFWLVHLGQAAVWAGEVDLAAELAERLARLDAPLDWLAAAAAWLRGLVSEHSGDPMTARAHLLAAAADGSLDAMPLHRALLDDDLARVHTRLGHPRPAKLALAAMAQRFAALGLPSPGAAHAADRAATGGVLDTLSDRERDVVGLVVEGFSSAQIARELFATRSTVTFHLSRVFAKTNTTSRYELAELVRNS